MNNANCYTLEGRAKYIYESDSEEEYQFHGSHIIRTQKSMSMMSSKQARPKQAEMKKSNSFLLSSKAELSTSVRRPNLDSKDKSKATKKCLNVTQGFSKPTINSKNSLAKTSASVGNASTKPMKSNKRRSISRDFLILGSQIYSCQNIEQVNQKLVCGQTSAYNHERFIKLTLKNQTRIQNYLAGFARYLAYRSASKPALNVASLTLEEKRRLYVLLKTEASLEQSHGAKRQSKQFSIDDLIEQAYSKIQEQTNQTITKTPQSEPDVIKWKRTQINQLMEIQSCLKSPAKSADRKILPPDLSQPCSPDDSHHMGSSCTAQEFKNSKISNRLLEQKFPKELHSNKKQRMAPRSYLSDEHNLSRVGIEGFLQNLWDFLVDSSLVSTLVMKLKSPYQLSHAQKWQFMGQQRGTGSIMESPCMRDHQILQNEVFIQFCKSRSEIGSEVDGLPEEQRKCKVIFQKAVFDALNLQLLKFQTDFPSGPYHPFENNANNSAYLIDEENAMLVWDECIAQVLTSAQVYLGLLNFSGEEFQAGAKAHQESQFKQVMRQEFSLCEWGRFLPLSYRFAYESVMKTVEEQLLTEAIDEFAIFEYNL